MDAAWTTSVIVVCVVALLAVVAVDRNRVRRRLDATEAALVGVRLDLAAATDRIEELQGYLNQSDSWRVDTPTPPEIEDPTVPDRWTPTTTADESDSAQTHQTRGHH